MFVNFFHLHSIFAPADGLKKFCLAFGPHNSGFPTAGPIFLAASFKLQASSLPLLLNQSY
jgi:hypothetical protein